MARRKKHKTSRRRRRVGALSLSASSPLMKFGAPLAGYFLGDKINSAVDKATGGKVDGKIVAGAEVAAGFLLMKNKGTAMKVLGGLLLGAGAKKALTEFGIISGFRSVPVLNGYNVPAPLPASMNGFQDVPTVGSYNVPSQADGLIGGISDHDLNADGY